VVDIIVNVLEKADSYDLVTLDYLKTVMGIPSSVTTQDAMLQQYITTYSDAVAWRCNRIFGKEHLTETIRDLQSNRVFLTRYPINDIADIVAVECPRGTPMDTSTYEIELASGKIELMSVQTEPIFIDYTGGYDLPEEAPPALAEAATLMIREAQMAAARYSTGGVRALTHKESRVVFFDPAAQIKATSSIPGGAGSTIDMMLRPFIRILC
jgi:hypothetical protein